MTVKEKPFFIITTAALIASISLTVLNPSGGYVGLFAFIWPIIYLAIFTGELVGGSIVEPVPEDTVEPVPEDTDP